MKQWGFVRENTEKAIKSGIDKDTGLSRTGLNEYLSVIFPVVNDWICDKAFVFQTEVKVEADQIIVANN